MYTISKLAKKAGVGVETIRFYERKKLLDQPEKPVNGYRKYPTKAFERVLFIKRAQYLGFTLDEIKNLMLLNKSNCNDVLELAESKLSIIEDKIHHLENLKRSLMLLISECKSNTSENDCPIIQSLQPTN